MAGHAHDQSNLYLNSTGIQDDFYSFPDYNGVDLLQTIPTPADFASISQPSLLSTSPAYAGTSTFQHSRQYLPREQLHRPVQAAYPPQRQFFRPGARYNDSGTQFSGFGLQQYGSGPYGVSAETQQFCTGQQQQDGRAQRQQLQHQHSRQGQTHTKHRMVPRDVDPVNSELHEENEPRQTSLDEGEDKKDVRTLENNNRERASSLRKWQGHFDSVEEARIFLAPTRAPDLLSVREDDVDTCVTKQKTYAEDLFKALTEDPQMPANFSGDRTYLQRTQAYRYREVVDFHENTPEATEARVWNMIGTIFEVHTQPIPGTVWEVSKAKDRGYKLEAELKCSQRLDAVTRAVSVCKYCAKDLLVGTPKNLEDFARSPVEYQRRKIVNNSLNSRKAKSESDGKSRKRMLAHAGFENDDKKAEPAQPQGEEQGLPFENTSQGEAAAKAETRGENSSARQKTKK